MIHSGINDLEIAIIGGLGAQELVVIFLIVLVLFGAGKIPKIAKDLGSGIREFKNSLNDNDDKNDK